jgi:adenylosuccinate synthase
MDEDWETTLGTRYDNYEKEFRAHGFELAKMDVPDKIESARQGKSVPRALGTKQEFLAKLADVRAWYQQRDMIQNTFIIHEKAYRDLSNGFMFEGAQAMGLHAWLGRLPDVTASDMSMNGITAGTKFWKGDEVEQGFGVFKFSYMSSVGATEWKTQYDIPRTAVSDEARAAMSDEQKYALWIREEAKETGTTTGRYRDICKLDMAMMRYNCHMGGIGMLAGTHLDIAQDTKDSIQVCTHYEDLAGNYVAYEPGIHHRKDVVPHYEKFDGWDGKKVQDAASFEDLPDNAKKFLAFLQKQMGIPIVFATTGYKRHNILEIPKTKIPKEVMRKKGKKDNVFYYGAKTA